jgi:endonuclease/exonuclease/phosphatase family metal-dependent hydrolase
MTRFAWLLIPAVLACGGDDDDDVAADARVADAAAPGDSVVPADATPVTMPSLPETLPTPLPTGERIDVVTYNLGLIQTVKGAMERLPFLVAAIEAADADVLCLQEVWNQYTSPAQLAAMLAGTYPHAWWSSTDDETVYGNGVVIVSKHPLYRGRRLHYVAEDPASVVDRTLLGVDVVTGDSYFHILCAHLTAYSTPENVAIRQAQIVETKQFAMAEGYWDGPTIWMGDLNTGPATVCDTVSPPGCATCLDFDDETYGTHLISDWTDPHAAASFCTYCFGDAHPLQLLPYQCGIDWEYDQRIDHCLTRGTASVLQAGSGRVFDQMVSIPAGADTLETLSDHYGVRCVLGPP